MIGCNFVRNISKVSKDVDGQKIFLQFGKMRVFKKNKLKKETSEKFRKQTPFKVTVFKFFFYLRVGNF